MASVSALFQAWTVGSNPVFGGQFDPAAQVWNPALQVLSERVASLATRSGQSKGELS